MTQLDLLEATARRIAAHAAKNPGDFVLSQLALNLQHDVRGLRAQEQMHAPSRGREPLEGMLMLDLRAEGAPTLTFGREQVAA